MKPTHFIDAHVHLMSPKRLRGGIRWIRKITPNYEYLSLDVTIEDLLNDLRQAGVEAIFNYYYPLEAGDARGINRWQGELARRNKGVIPFGSLHVEDKDKEGLISEALDELNLAGLKLHPYVQKFELLDPRLQKVYEAVEERDCPLVIHTGFSQLYGCKPIAEDVKELMRRYPQMKLVIAHMLYPDLPLEEWDELLERYPKVYLDATNTFSFCRFNTPQAASLINLLNKKSQRIMYGSDYPMGMDYPLGNLYALIYKFVRTQETLENICWRTATKVTGKDLVAN